MNDAGEVVGFVVEALQGLAEIGDGFASVSKRRRRRRAIVTLAILGVAVIATVFFLVFP